MDSLTNKQVKEAIPDRDPNKLQMVVIDGVVWIKGPDGLWYRSECPDDG